MQNVAIFSQARNRRRLKSRVVISVILATSSALPAISEAKADGNQRNRIADAAKVGLTNVVPDCQGRLFENYADSVDDKGWTYSLRLTCASSLTSAEWSLIANSRCYDDAGANCLSAAAKLIPPFSTFSNSNADGRQTFVANYQLLKYGLGRNCQIVKQPFTSATLAPNVSTSTQSVWICSQLDFFDGTSNADGLIADPKDFRTISVTTSAFQPLVAGTQEADFPKGFLALPFLYSFQFP